MAMAVCKFDRLKDLQAEADKYLQSGMQWPD